jgi:hypothetical protein
MRPRLLPSSLLTGCALVAAVATPAPARADASSAYSFDLVVRTNLPGNASGAFMIDPGYDFSGETLQLDDRGDVSLIFTDTPDGDRAMFFRPAGGTGSLLYRTPVDAFADETSLAGDGRILVALSQQTTGNGLYVVTPPAMGATLLTGGPIGATDWTNATLNNAGHIGTRAALGSGNVLAVYDGSMWSFIAMDTGVDSSSLYTFLFAPAFNNADQLCAKAMLKTGGTAILRFPGPGAAQPLPLIMATDTGADSTSPYARFDNGCSINDAGDVAFIAELAQGGQRTVVRADATTAAATTIATEGTPAELASIEFFPPSLSATGEVAFRVQEGANQEQEALYVGDGQSLVRVVGDRDLLPSDQGMAMVAQNDPTFPVFDGPVTINGAGQVIFAVGLAPPGNDQEEWGTGVYVASPLGRPPLDGGPGDGGTGDVAVSDAGADATGGDGGGDGGTGADVPQVFDFGPANDDGIPDLATGRDTGGDPQGSGCSCRVAQAGTGAADASSVAGGLLLALLAGAVLLGRRRRARDC